MIVATRATPASLRSSSVGSTSSPTTSSGTPAVVPQMTLTLTTMGGSLLLDFSCTFDVRSGDAGSLQFYLDGSPITGTSRGIQFTASSGILGLVPGAMDRIPIAMTWRIDGLSAGSHTVDVRWTRSAGTLRAVGTERMLTAVEM